jgi:hypothetical protein
MENAAQLSQVVALISIKWRVLYQCMKKKGSCFSSLVLFCFGFLKYGNLSSTKPSSCNIIN